MNQDIELKIIGQDVPDVESQETAAMEPHKLSFKPVIVVVSFVLGLLSLMALITWIIVSNNEYLQQQVMHYTTFPTTPIGFSIETPTSTMAPVVLTETQIENQVTMAPVEMLPIPAGLTATEDVTDTPSVSVTTERTKFKNYMEFLDYCNITFALDMELIELCRVCKTRWRMMWYPHWRNYTSPQIEDIKYTFTQSNCMSNCYNNNYRKVCAIVSRPWFEHMVGLDKVPHLYELCGTEEECKLTERDFINGTTL